MLAGVWAFARALVRSNATCAARTRHPRTWKWRRSSFFPPVPTAWSIGDQIVNIQASWNLCDVPWELLIPALSVLFEDTSHQEWRGGLEAKYHSAEPWRLNSRRVQVTQQMERSATRSSSPIRLCFAHVSH